MSTKRTRCPFRTRINHLSRNRSSCAHRFPAGLHEPDIVDEALQALIWGQPQRCFEQRQIVRIRLGLPQHIGQSQVARLDGPGNRGEPRFNLPVLPTSRARRPGC